MSDSEQPDDGGLVTREEIEQYEEENDETHPVFEVDHRPEPVTFNDGRCLWDDCEDEDTVKAEVYGTSGEPEKTRVCEDYLDELRYRTGVSVEVLES